MLSALRKEMNSTTPISFQVDFDTFFPNLHLGPGTSNKPCSTVYQGTSAMSENEAQNVDRFLKSEKERLAGFLDVFNYSQMWMIPWGYTKENIKDYDELVSNNKLLLMYSSNTVWHEIFVGYFADHVFFLILRRVAGQYFWDGS